MTWLCFSGRFKHFAPYFGDKSHVLPSVGNLLDHCVPYLPISVPLTLFSIPGIQPSIVPLPVLPPDNDFPSGFLPGPSTPRWQSQFTFIWLPTYTCLGPSVRILVGEARLVRHDAALDTSRPWLLLEGAVVSGSYDLGGRKEFWHFLGAHSFSWQPYKEDSGLSRRDLNVLEFHYDQRAYIHCLSVLVNRSISSHLPKGQGSGFSLLDLNIILLNPA